jgi:hypothetical protein
MKMKCINDSYTNTHTRETVAHFQKNEKSQPVTFHLQKKIAHFRNQPPPHINIHNHVYNNKRQKSRGEYQRQESGIHI